MVVEAETKNKVVKQIQVQKVHKTVLYLQAVLILKRLMKIWAAAVALDFMVVVQEVKLLQEVQEIL